MVKRLDEIIVGAGVEPGDTLVDRSACGDDQHRQADMLPPDPLQELQAVAVRKAEIEENQIVLARGNGGLGIAQRRNAVEPPTRVMHGLADEFGKGEDCPRRGVNACRSQPESSGAGDGGP